MPGSPASFALSARQRLRRLSAMLSLAALLGSGLLVGQGHLLHAILMLVATTLLAREGFRTRRQLPARLQGRRRH